MPLVLSGTGGVSGVDGTASTPSYEGTDSNTGIFFPAADTIAFAEGGVEVARFDSSGNLGIGTTTPTAPLDVNGNLAITGNARRITGDFSNATPVNRVALQTSTANGNTTIEVLPNGTGTNAGIAFESDSAASNGANLQAVLVGASDARFVSGIRGTGTFLPMTFYTGGSERMRILTDGSISMTTSGSANTTHLFRFNENGGEIVLNNNAGASGTLIDFSSGSTRLLHVLSTGDQQIGIGGGNTTGSIQFMRAGFAEAMRIDSSGNVGIGTSTPADAQLTTAVAVNAASGYCGFRVLSNGTAVGRVVGSVGEFRVDSLSTNPLTLYTNGNERARIDSSGNLLVGTTSTFNSARFSVDGSSGLGATVRGTGTVMRVGINGNGTATLIAFRSLSDSFDCGNITTNTANTVYSTSSDYRLKENVVPLTGALEKVSALRPVKWTWKHMPSLSSEGFIAHEVQKVCPDAVTGEKDAVDSEGNPQYQGIDTSFLVATLTAGLQEAVAMIEELKAKVAALEGK